MKSSKHMTQKQFIKAKTHMVAYMIHRELLPANVQDELTMETVLEVFPKVSYYKNQQGEIRVGLSLRGIKKLIKRWPYITPNQVMTYFNTNGRDAPNES